MLVTFIQAYIIINVFLLLCVIVSNALGDSTGLIAISPVVKWFDIWVGFFWDTKSKKLYYFPFPMIGLVVSWQQCPRCNTRPVFLETINGVHLCNKCLEKIPSHSKVHNF